MRLRRDTRSEVEKALAWERDELSRSAERAQRLAQAAAVDLGRPGGGGLLNEPALVLVGLHAYRTKGVHGSGGQLLAVATRDGAIRVTQSTGRLLDDRGDQLDGQELFSVRLGGRRAGPFFALDAPDGREMGVVQGRVAGVKPQVERAYGGRYRRCPICAGAVRVGTVAMPVGRLGLWDPMGDWYIEEAPGKPLARTICAERDPERVGYVAELDDRATTLQRAITVGTMLAAEAKRIVATH